VVSVLESDYLTQGPAIGKFESALAEYSGAEYCVVFSSGTAALHAAYFAAGLRDGDEIITSPITFVATSNAALYLGAKVVFSDVEPDTANLDVGKIEEKITENTKILVPVHYAGHPVDMVRLRALGDKHKLMVIEDACHALGAQYRTWHDGWDRIGSCTHSDMTILSFHPVKHIATGEGGAVLTKNKILYDKLLMFRSHGITKNRMDFLDSSNGDRGEWYYEMQLLGYNYRMTDIQAALGKSQLRKVERFVQARREIAAHYDNVFKHNVFFDLPVERDYCKSSYHLYAIRLKDYLANKRAAIFARMREEGLGVQVLYIPVYLQPYYQKLGYKSGLCPVAEDFYNRAISIPIYHGMTLSDREKVVEMVFKVMEEVNCQ
jgi:UDP-4-amino-4,6-dideoxy-N-acetyl-beta-L-altrosamine transaminase